MSWIKSFMRMQASSGLVLFAATLCALALSNGSLALFYQTLWQSPVGLFVGAWRLEKPLILWINDALMACFFFLVGLELKRELLQGHLKEKAHRIFPCLTALGGLIVPALVYTSFIDRQSQAHLLSGWAIPTATDIAFAMGILSLLGARVPQVLKTTLMSIAILDDLAAILIIALFYTQTINIELLLWALLVWAVIACYGLRTSRPKGLMMAMLGIVLWYLILKSGVHATLAGVAVALCVPLKNRDGVELLKTWEHQWHPWVAYGILPLFAFANAGVDLRGVSWQAWFDPVTSGIFWGLAVGKCVGVMMMALLARLVMPSTFPRGLSWTALTGMAFLTGVGFTMSLFIAGLAFSQGGQEAAVRLGVLAGSSCAGLLGLLLLRIGLSSPRTHEIR